jgi:hypothetical protein
VTGHPAGAEHHGTQQARKRYPSDDASIRDRKNFQIAHLLLEPRGTQKRGATRDQVTQVLKIASVLGIESTEVREGSLTAEQERMKQEFISDRGCRNHVAIDAATLNIARRGDVRDNPGNGAGVAGKAR